MAAAGHVAAGPFYRHGDMSRAAAGNGNRDVGQRGALRAGKTRDATGDTFETISFGAFKRIEGFPEHPGFEYQRIAGHPLPESFSEIAER